MRVERIGDGLVAIYALCEPDWRPRYVGKTVRYLHERHKQHITAAKRENPKLPVHRWMKKKIATGAALAIKLLEYARAGDWIARESFWISKFREEGHELLNLTRGGEGLPGLQFSDEHRSKIRLALTKKVACRCKHCGEEFRRKPCAVGEATFCSRKCYSDSLKGISRSLPTLAVARGVAAAAIKRRARTHCANGHEWNGQNTRLNRRGARVCRICTRAAKQAYLERRRVEA